MTIKFGEHIRLDSPKPISIENDFSDAVVAKITNKVVIDMAERIDGEIINKIVDMARLEGIDDIYLLDKKNILSALEKQIPKKPIKINEDYNPERGIWVADYECPSCGNPYADNSYCSCCGQALDWGDING